MIDTVKLRSPYIPENLAAAVARRCKERSCVDLSTGLIEYSLTSGSLAGTWDSRLSVRVETEEWAVDRDGKKLGKVPCSPYLVIEGSVHKAMLGHNVFGGPVDVGRACAWLISELGRRIGCNLPDVSGWRLRRIDWAEVFDLGSSEGVQEYMSGLNAASYPRRTVHRYGRECVFAPGQTSAVRIYHKGPEFRKHDMGRLVGPLGHELVGNLSEQASRLLRMEVSIKARKLDSDFGGEPSVLSVTAGYCEDVWSREVGRLLREGGSEMEQVRTHREVRARLYEVYSEARARALYCTWLELSALGDLAVREHMSRATFYRHRSALEAAGCSWLGGDVIVKAHSRVPSGFSPRLGDSRRLCEVAEAVRVQCAGFLVKSA